MTDQPDQPPQWPTSAHLRRQQTPAQWGTPPATPTPPPGQPPTPTPAARNRRTVPVVVLVFAIIAAFAGGVGVGSSGSSKEVTPASCVQALDLASEGFGTIGDGLQDFSAAASTLDTGAASAAAGRIETWVDQHQTRIRALTSDCRAQAR